MSASEHWQNAIPARAPRVRGRRGRGLRLHRWLLGVAMLLSLSVSADERILAYDSRIEILPDASLLVTETIHVRSEGKQIRRGIFREFPTRYRTRKGDRVRVDFTLLDVTRNGQAEPHHTESRSNGVVVYIGDQDRLLTPGEHRYQLRYRTNRQLGFFADFDELYWNVTGSDWAFPIDAATAEVVLPKSTPREQLSLAFFTGPQGADGRAARAAVIDGGRVVRFQSTAPLAPQEGLTVVVGFPKGLVAEPTRQQEWRWFLRDNLGVLILLLGFFLVLGWYLWAWNRTGRDPEKGVIIPRYEPPTGLSPAACRYVLKMGFHQQAFTAALVSLGVKGYLKIEEDDGDFTLHRTGDDAGEKASRRPAPSPGEQAVFDALLPGKQDKIVMEQDEHAAFGTARTNLLKALKREYKGRLFNLNGRYSIPAFIMTVVAFVLAAVLQQGNPLIWISWFLLITGVHAVFLWLLRAPTVIGRQVMDEIEGFKLYLSTAERDRLDRMRSPQMTPELFERFLPYAFALGVENQWTTRFQSEIPRAEREAAGYHPAWYSGQLGPASSIHHIGSKLNSQLSGAISSAATPPGSSSGGGGFSGGGGGGGGGGGW